MASRYKTYAEWEGAPHTHFCPMCRRSQRCDPGAEECVRRPGAPAFYICAACDAARDRELAEDEGEPA